MRIKAIKFGTKAKRFNLDNIRTFEEIYRGVENSCAILRDIDNLA
jgi:predicted ribonuclease YlaK